MILVKFGGSVITDKMKLRYFRRKNVDRLSQEIANAAKNIILVHGAGSFGHIVAHEFELQRGLISAEQLKGLAKVMLDVRELNYKVMEVLVEKGLKPVSIPPSTSARLDSGELTYLDTDIFDKYLKIGFLPVTFGDACLDSSRTFGICSGDQLMERLAMYFKPKIVIFCTDVDGIYTSDPFMNPNAELLEEIDHSTLEKLPKTSRYVDVTGSMYGKIERMVRIASRGCECLVINGNVPGRLESALKGERVKGTRIIGG